MKTTLHCPWGLLIAAATVLTGCVPQDGIQRYHVSGEVTYQGEPVPVGMISFEPLESGVSGGFAPIRNGKFDTADGGRGHLGGPCSIRISGFDGIKNPANPDAPPNALFPTFDTQATLPDSTDEIDFSLPLDSSASS